MTSHVEREAVHIAQRLIQFDTSNFGDAPGPGERAAAEYVAESLAEVGWDPVIVESEPRRATVLLRIPGREPERGALVVHGHSDVVPAHAPDWSVDPFGGEIKDGMLWGRGAVDMKQMVGMMVAIARDMKRSGWAPRRDIALAVFADEESGGRKGSHWVVDNHPEFFDGATDAISEVGGYSVTVDGRRIYLVQTAEKGLHWLRLLAHGPAGHGSLLNEDNAVTRLAGAVHRIGTYAWPLHLTPTVTRLLDGVAELTGMSYDPDDQESIYRIVDALGPSGAFVRATVKTGVSPTQLDAGYKANVVPSTATAAIDMRTIPGTEEEAIATLRELAGPGVELQDINRDVGLEVPFEGELVDAMIAAVHAEDPEAAVLPYMLSAGTDNKALSRLGIRGYGFTPLKLPAGFDFAGMFHAVDEHIPVDAIEFGVRALTRLLRNG